MNNDNEKGLNVPKHSSFNPAKAAFPKGARRRAGARRAGARRGWALVLGEGHRERVKMAEPDPLTETAILKPSELTVDLRPFLNGNENRAEMVSAPSVLAKNGTGAGGRTLDLWIHNPAL